MAVTTTKTNKPLNPRGNDQSPKGYNRAELYSGKALDFDGVNDTVETSAVPLPSAGAICFYYQADATGKEIAECGGSTDDFRITINSLCGFYTGAEYRIQTSGLWPIDDKFHFVVFTWGDFGTKFYLNGQFVKENTNRPADFSSIPTTLYIGSRDGGNNWFNGQLSGFKIFNTALTAAQVADLYNNPEKIVPTGVSNDALKLWLPMQEGAGTTAYDGSGNGNHGTISGATWQHGIGAPVSQTAVIDWNKGTNRMIYSEQFDNAAWLKANTTVTANDTTAPDGSQTADKIEFTAPGSEIYDQFVNVASSLHIGSVFLKNEDIGSVQLEIIGGSPGILGQTTIDLTDGSLSASVGDYTPVATDAGNGWYRVSVGDTGNATIATPALKIKRVGSNGSFYAWGAQVEAADSLGPYIPTLATAQTSDVLLPAGLTAGRDITGVNLFENVRKQGALNLDGNSWAEVHDNESLDFGTGSFSLEAWVKVDYVNQGSSYNSILTLGGSSTAGTALNTRLGIEIRFYYNGSESKTSVTIGDWVHIVGTYDETNATLYLNGSQVDQDARTATNITNTSSKMIGHDTANNRQYPNQIAQPRIYNRALTAEEVERNYSAGKNTYK